jgi:hypothetical protein
MEEKWKYKLPTFPIAVWLQSPQNAARYRAAGINLYIGLWEGPTEPQLTALKAANMPVICEQNAVGVAHRNDPLILGWMHGDEPDNAQPVTDPKTGEKGWGPCVPPEKIVADYRKLQAADPTRPILLNLGQGVANDAWIGRGAGAKLDDYKTYVQGCDIVSYDVYPIADGLPIRLVPKGVDRLRQWTKESKPVWNCIECTHINGKRKATPRQVRAEVWMSLTHGSNGLIYFVHEFQPKFNEWALLDDPPMLAEVTTINRQITELAPVLARPTERNAGTATPVAEESPIDAMVKRHQGATYLFTVGMVKKPTRVTFTLGGLGREATAEVLGESRRIPVREGRFEDMFQPEDVHLYRVTAGRA